MNGWKRLCSTALREVRELEESSGNCSSADSVQALTASISADEA